MAPKHPQILLENRKPDRIITLEEYEQNSGYAGLNATLEPHREPDIIQMLDDASLLGRGGAAFPTGFKLKTVAPDAPFPRYIVCNADEMEPGTFKDRVLIHTNPHMMIEGMIIAGYTIKAEKGVIFIRPEYESGAQILEREVKQAEKAGYLGKTFWAAITLWKLLFTAVAVDIFAAK